MSLDRVRAAVMDHARAEADRLAAEARAQADKTAADGAAEAGRLRAEALREAKLRADRALARELGQVRQEGRMALLAAKTAQMDKVFAEARARFLALTDKERVEIAAGWIGQLPADAGGALHVAAADAGAFTARLEALNRGRADGAGFTAVAVDAEVAAGARVAGADYTADCTLDRRLEQLREGAVAELAEKLFRKA